MHAIEPPPLVNELLHLAPLPDAAFGALARPHDGIPAKTLVERLESEANALPGLLYASNGLVVLRTMQAIAEAPELLLRLSRLFGSEVENYRLTGMDANMVHPEVPEIFIVSNASPVNRQPPPKPEPPLTEQGELPTRFPHRRGWHTDQSYRRPPPDISLFFAVKPAPRGQAQTLYANGVLAYEALPPESRAQIDALEGIHAKPRTGRSEQAVRAGEPPAPVAAHERPQRQPLVRRHPVTGKKALFLCEAGQMDWVDGPIVGMQRGVNGDGARLVYDLMRHYTDPRFTYTHEWTRGDLIIYDNRSLIHSATWFDASAIERVMWRTTVSGNPGVEYAGEAKSWLPAA